MCYGGDGTATTHKANLNYEEHRLLTFCRPKVDSGVASSPPSSAVSRH